MRGQSLTAGPGGRWRAWPDSGAGEVRVATLDVGCGIRKLSGAVGIDGNPRTQADIVHDLNRTPWPLGENQFDHVYCRHVLEHLEDIVRTMEEIHRVAQPGALVEILTPHFSSLYSWRDPTHRHHLSLESFDYFTEGPALMTFYTQKRFVIERKEIRFGSALISWIPRLIARLSPHKYENHFAFIFPAKELYFRLRVIK